LTVSARAPSSRFALVALLGFWGLNCLLAPRTLSDIAAAVYPLPEPISFKTRMQAALNDPVGVAVMMKKRTAELLQEHGVTQSKDLPLNLAGLSLQLGEDHGYDVFDRFYQELYSPMEAQNGLLQAGAVLFPLLGVQALSMSLSGTDLAQHRDFAAAAEAHRRTEIKIINDDILAHPVKGGDVHLGDRELWAKVPEFSYEPPGVGWVLSRNFLPMALLVIWLAGAAWFAWRSAAKLRPV
jgi:ABC-2 type transport system permease protein